MAAPAEAPNIMDSRGPEFGSDARNPVTPGHILVEVLGCRCQWIGNSPRARWGHPMVTSIAVGDKQRLIRPISVDKRQIRTAPAARQTRLRALAGTA